MKLTSDFTPICHLLLDFDRKVASCGKSARLIEITLDLRFSGDGDRSLHGNWAF